MNETHDELAGVVDLFGGLTRRELIEALTELAFKRGEEPDESRVEAAVADAIDAYALVAVGSVNVHAAGESESANRERIDRESADSDGVRDETLLLPGPTAFPTLPAAAEDLPHIMDVDRREIDREAAGDQVLARLRAEADAAVDDGDEQQCERLLDVSYDVEAWAPVEADVVRARLDDALST